MKRRAKPGNHPILRLVLGAVGILLVWLLALSIASPGRTAPADLSTLLPGGGVSQQTTGDGGQGAPAAAGESLAINRGVLTVAHFDVSPPLRDIPPLVATPGPLREIPERGIAPGKQGGVPGEDTVVQKVAGAPAIPTPLLSFDGPSNTSGVAPPDPDGEVGPNNYVTMINLSFQIFNKSGVSLYGPALNNTLWAGFGGACQNENQGDPIVLYDQLADRWLMSQFTANGPTYYNCVALSTTNDPTGSFYRWAFSTGSNFPDYPKFGMWPDAYYISNREFLNGATYVGVGAYAANRAQMLAGNPAPTVISFFVPLGATPYYIGDGLLPADLDGTALPPTGSPNYYVGSMDNGGPYGAPQDALNLWKFHADFSNPPASTFVRTNTLPIAGFDTMFPCSPTSRNCIAQPGTTMKVDHLGYRQRPLFRLAYRNMGSYETLVTNQSVEAATNISGIRWWEIRSPASSPVIYQEGTYAPGVSDSIQRWMGSIAMDKNGNMALGYSASNGTTTYPSSWYTGRLAGDPLGTMPQGEAAVINGTGSQTGSARWGDYTDMTVDPVDDCTFWYVNQYNPTTSSIGWRIRIGAFKFAGCAVSTPTPVPTATPPPCGTPIPGSWTAIAPLNTARSRVGVVYFAPTDRFYALGGEAATGRDIPIEEYNPTANTWTDRAHLLTGVSNTGAAVVGNYIYVPGGYDGTNSRADMQRFDPVANAVVTMSPLPAGNYGQAVVALGTKIYVLGGSSAGTEGTTNFIYDTTTDTWSSGAPVPTAVEYAAATTDGVYIYLIGGRTQAVTDLNVVQRYYPLTNTWTAMPNLNSARGGPGAFFDGLRLWAVNGGWGSHLSSTEMYAIGDPNWTVGPSTLAGTRTLGAAFSASRNMAIKAGGYDTDYSAEAEKLTFTTVPCATATPVNTNTPTVTSTPTSTNTVVPTATSTACTLTFNDVPPGSTFYPYIRCLACRGIINGYPDGSFKPNNNVTRGQFSKIAANSAGFNEPPGAQQFQDVPPGSTFFPYIWRLYYRGLINGYACGGPGEACVPPANLPYFRPNANITRGQLTKIDSNAAGFSDPPAGQQFQDVPVGSTFYTYTYRLVTRTIMSGYPCGGGGEPCVPPDNLPYFRPNNNASRGQASKIVANTFFPDCETPLTRP